MNVRVEPGAAPTVFTTMEPYDLARFAPIDEILVPAGPYVLEDVDTGAALLDVTPDDALPRESLGPAMLTGVRYVLLSPAVLRVLARGAIFGFGAVAVQSLLPLIARELHISDETVRTHVRNAMEKTGTHTRAALVATAFAQKLI